MTARILPRILPRILMLLALAATGMPVEAAAARADSTPTPAAHEACIEATRAAERRHHIAPHLLGAISLAETGRWDQAHRASFAWPWTVMAEGRGRYLPSKAAAIAEVMKLQARGVKNIDVGCMQVNLYYHADAFDDLNQAFDPETNANYAAAFLRDLKDEVGTWKDAVAYYHSRDDRRGDAYQGRVYDLWYGQRTNLVTAAAGSIVPVTPQARAADQHRAELARERSRRAQQYEMIKAARAANAEFLRRQREIVNARTAAAFEARKAEVMAEWEELKRKRAAARAGG